MQTVNLYIDTSRKGPRRGDGKYLYLLETQTSRGTATADKKGKLEDATENQLVLQALEEALKRLNRPCRLMIYLECGYVAAVLKNGWAERWEENGWESCRKRPVKDAEKWRSILHLLNAQDFTVLLREEHPYRDWMERELKGAERG